MKMIPSQAHETGSTAELKVFQKFSAIASAGQGFLFLKSRAGLYRGMEMEHGISLTVGGTIIPANAARLCKHRRHCIL